MIKDATGLDAYCFLSRSRISSRRTTSSGLGAGSAGATGATVIPASGSPSATADAASKSGYRVEISFPLETLRGWGLAPDGTLHLGLYRADAVRPDEIFWYTLIDPRTPEPDFHVPASLFGMELGGE